MRMHPGVVTAVTVKVTKNSALMHVKSYEIDGSMLRTGSANFSASGLKRQDNDLIVIKDAQVAAKFKHTFDMRFARAVSDQNASYPAAAK